MLNEELNVNEPVEEPTEELDTPVESEEGTEAEQEVCLAYWSSSSEIRSGLGSDGTDPMFCKYCKIEQIDLAVTIRGRHVRTRVPVEGL